jgi:hypothetical protein
VRFEIEQRDLERTPRDRRSPEQNDRLTRLEDDIRELRILDAALEAVIREGFAPANQKIRLRELAIDDAVLSLTRAFLKRLSQEISDGPLSGWELAATQTGLHTEFATWVAEAVDRLSTHCSKVRPDSPFAMNQTHDPTCEEVVLAVAGTAEAIVSNAVHHMCDAWWSRFHEVLLVPLDVEMKDAREQIAALDENLELTLSDRRVRKRELNDRVRALKGTRLHRVTKANNVRRVIEEWRCPAALSWGPWLSQQPMFDEFASPDGRRPAPTSIAAFVTQEGAYDPDINDGVRVNIAPLQKAGVLAAQVLAPADADKAIADRAEWRADERRWGREGRLSQPGWWSRREADER